MERPTATEPEPVPRTVRLRLSRRADGHWTATEPGTTPVGAGPTGARAAANDCATVAENLERAGDDG